VRAACATRRHAGRGRRAVFSGRLAHAGARPRARHCARAGGSPQTRSGAALRGMGIGGAGLSEAAALQPARLAAQARHAARHRGHDGKLRRAATQPRAAFVHVFRRQPAKVGAGPRGAAAAQGAAVSSELDEILALADRVIVMDRGRIAGELPIDACNETALGRLMAGEAVAI
jgi:hypothetical protein